MKKVLAFLLVIMLLAGSAAMAEEAEQELYYLRGWGIGGDTQGPVTGWVGDLWAKRASSWKRSAMATAWSRCKSCWLLATFRM